MSDSLGLVLLYHRVAEVAVDPFSMCVSPANFEDQLRVLSEKTIPVSLRSLASTAAADRRAPGVAVTFDDGYADNVFIAAPMLERYRIPATFFLVAEGLNGEREFWWDELERALLLPPELPAELRLCMQRREYCWTVNDDRRQLYSQVWALLRGLSGEDRQVLLNEILRWAGDLGRVRSSHRRAALAELQSLGKSPLVAFGGHTLTHPSLARLQPPLQQREIMGCKTRLEEALHCSIEAFAYPFGQPEDVSAETTGMIREAGFSMACVAMPGHVTFLTDPCRIPRYAVPDLPGPEFGQWLARCLSGEERFELERELRELRAWTEDVLRGKAWLEREWIAWKQIAEQREAQLESQQSWIEELEAGKQWLEQQWVTWRAVAERTLEKPADDVNQGS